MPVTPVKGEEKIELALSQKLQNTASQDPASWRRENTVTSREAFSKLVAFNPLNAELNPICHFQALLGARHILHVSRIRVKLHKMAFVVRNNSLGEIGVLGACNCRLKYFGASGK